MSNLVEIKNDKLSKVADTYREIIIAQEGLKCREIHDQDLRGELIKLIGELYVSIRWSSPLPNELIVMAEQLIQDYIRKWFNNYTVNEIKLVCKKGIIKVYGDFTTISAATIGTWLHKDSGSPERAEAYKIKRRLEKPEEVKQVDMSDLEKNKKAFEMIQKYFKETGNAPHIGDWDRCFFHLESVKEISDSIEEKKMFMENVVEELKSYINETAKNRFQREDMLQQWTDIKVKQECRKRRCIIYFEAQS